MSWSEVSDYGVSCCAFMQIFFNLSSTKYYSSCQLKGWPSSVHFKVALIRLQGNIISSSFKNVLNKPWRFHQNRFQNHYIVSSRQWHYTFFVLLVYESLQQICTRYSIFFFYVSIETCYQVKLFLFSESNLWMHIDTVGANKIQWYVNCWVNS